MNKMDKFLWNTKTKAQIAMNKISRKAAGDETLLVKIILIVVAVFLVGVFRNTLNNMVTTFLNTANTKISAMFG